MFKMNDFNFNTTPGIIFGNGVSFSSCDRIIDKLGDNIFLITDADLTKIGLNKPIINELSKSSNLEVFDDVESDPSKKTLIKYWSFYEDMFLNNYDPYEKPLHELYKKINCFSPMPSLGLHMTNVNSIYGLSPLKDWVKMWNKSEY